MKLALASVSEFFFPACERKSLSVSKRERNHQPEVLVKSMELNPKFGDLDWKTDQWPDLVYVRAYHTNITMQYCKDSHKDTASSCKFAASFLTIFPLCLAPRLHLNSLEKNCHGELYYIAPINPFKRAPLYSIHSGLLVVHKYIR